MFAHHSLSITDRSDCFKIMAQDRQNTSQFEDKWPSMRPIVLKLLRQEPVTQNEWQDLFYSIHSVSLWDEQGKTRIKEALESDINDFIQQAQEVKKSCSLSFIFITDVFLNSIFILACIITRR